MELLPGNRPNFILFDLIIQKTPTTRTNFLVFQFYLDGKRIRVESNKKWKTNHISRTRRTCIEFHFYLIIMKKILVATYIFRTPFCHINPVLMVFIFSLSWNFSINKNCHKYTDTYCKLVDGSTIFCIFKTIFCNNFFKKVRTSMLNLIDVKKKKS